MALTLNRFMGMETGGLEEWDTIVGSPIADSVNPRSGAFSLKLDTISQTATIDPLGLVASGGSGFIIGFGIFVDALGAVGDEVLLQISEAGGIILQLIFDDNVDGQVNLKNSINVEVDQFTGVLIAGQWVYIELFFEQLDSGNYEFFVDGVSKGSGTSDFSRGGAIDSCFFGRVNPSAGDHTYYDDVYVLTGATAASDRLGGTLGVEVFKYQSVKASITPDDGGANLGVGQWGDAGETPLNEALVAVYQTTGAGAVDSNTANGSPEGPLNDARIDGDANIKGMIGIWRMKRGGGGASDHFGLLGNDVDGTTPSADFAPTNQFATFFFLSELATIVPLSTEFCRIGFETTGAQDFNCAEMWAMLLHVPSEVVGFVPEDHFMPRPNPVEPVVSVW